MRRLGANQGRETAMGRFWGGASSLGKTVATATAVAALAAGSPMVVKPAPAAAAAAPFDSEIAGFYHARGGAPLWFAPRSGAAARQLIQLLATAQADHA